MNKHAPIVQKFLDMPAEVHCQHAGLFLTDLKVPEREGPGELGAKAPQPNILDEAADRQNGRAVPRDPSGGHPLEIGMGLE